MSKQRIILGAVALLIIGMGVLMMVDVPAQQQPIEKELDAKTFLEQKQ